MIYKSEFYHKNHQEILSNHFLENDWVWLYKTSRQIKNGTDVYYRYFAYLATPINSIQSLKSAKNDIEEDIRVKIFGDYSYTSYARNGFEHLVTVRTFQISNQSLKDIRIAEEIIYFHKLYERREGEEINYYQIIENKETLVCKINGNSVKILSRYLMEYMAAKKMDLVCYCQSEVEYDMNKYTPRFKIQCTPDLQFQTIRQSSDSKFEICIAPCFHIIQSWFHGKKIFQHISLKSFYDNMNPPLNFIIGTNEHGLSVYSSSETHPYTPVFFDKNIQTYYTNRQGYKIKELKISGPNFCLRCDNDNKDYIVVFLKDLLDLPYEEQFLWRSKNITPDGRMFSPLFQKSIIEGNWNGVASSIDFVFRDVYSTFIFSWENKYGEKIIKPLNGVQNDSPEKIYAVLDNDYEDLISLTRNLSLSLQESFNSDFLNKITERKEEFIEEKKDGQIYKTLKQEKPISHFHRVCEKLNIEDTELNKFLKHLQTLRSYMLHRNSSEIKKDTRKAFSYFELKEDCSNSKHASYIMLQLGVDALLSVIKQLT